MLFFKNLKRNSEATVDVAGGTSVLDSAPKLEALPVAGENSSANFKAMMDPNNKPEGFKGQETQPKPGEQQVVPPVVVKTEVPNSEEPKKIWEDPNKAAETALNVEVPTLDDLPMSPVAQLVLEKLGMEFTPEFLGEKDNIAGFVESFAKLVQEAAQPQYLSEEGQAFDSFMRNGGKPEQFFDTYYKVPVDYTNVKLETDSQKEQIIKDYLKKVSPTISDTMATKMVELYKLDGQLEAEANNSLKGLKETSESEKKQLVESQKAQAEQQRQTQIQAQQNEILAIKTSIATGGKDRLGFELSQEERAGFTQFLTEVDSKTGKTAYMKVTEGTPDPELRSAYLWYKGITSQEGLQKVGMTATIKNFADTLKKHTQTDASKGSNQGPGHVQSAQNHSSFYDRKVK